MGLRHGKEINFCPCGFSRTSLRRTPLDGSACPRMAGGIPRDGHGERARRVVHLAVKP
ncbi:predicted protein [Streptomyces filamentosus NRRL 15998]|uniref:Predicted protein n=1 Tax=Streptomyces filamentosus NRRL 15998 TaxID=457431 RepID=D6AGQ5_STRFL|nr:predicted protein [Streptomyces filamentosus NRRL 15998]